MSQKLILFLLSRISFALSAILTAPLICSIWHDEPLKYALGAPPLTAFVAGFVFRCAGRSHKNRVLIADAARYIAANWLLVIILGMLPYFVTGWLTLPDALFQATADAATVGIILLPAEAPPSLYLWHALLGWFGGANFLVLLVTMVPLASGCFGLLLTFRRGFIFSPMLGQMDAIIGKVLMVYIFLTATAWLIFTVVGRPAGEAAFLALLTISTTGGDLTPYLSSSLYPSLKLALALVIFLACGNFLRYRRTFERRDWRDLYRNREIRAFGALIAVFVVVMAAHLTLSGEHNPWTSLHRSIFYALSFAGTVGIVDPDFLEWPDLELFLLLILALIGGSIGSPTGGLKVFRFITLWKFVGAEVKRTLHPHMVPTVVVGGEAVPLADSGRMLAFFFLYTGTIFIFVIMLALADISPSEAVGLAVSTFTGLGTANGLYSPETILGLDAWVKIGVCVFMVLGRMEIFAFIVLTELTLNRQEKKW